MLVTKKLNTLTFRELLLLDAVASGSILLVALTAQYGFDLHPCELCIRQRWPYAAIIAIGLIGAFGVNTRKIQCWAGILCVALFAIDGGVAFYHAGVEIGWFPGPSDCTNPATGHQTLEEMRKAIMEATLVPCNQAMAHFFGLSMAAWNAIAAFILMTATFLGIRMIKRRA